MPADYIDLHYWFIEKEVHINKKNNLAREKQDYAGMIPEAGYCYCDMTESHTEGCYWLGVQIYKRFRIRDYFCYGKNSI